MDARRFDALARTLGTAASRRAVAALLAGIVAPLLPAPAVAGRRGKRKKGAGKGEERSGRGAGKHQGKHRRQGRAVRAEAVCYGGSPCIPGQGAYLANCDFGGSNALANGNCKGCNLSGASLKGADASGASFSKANLSNACLIDADLSGANLSGANTTGAKFCRTTMPNGSTNNSGCNTGTTCCPTCDAAHPCPAGQRCCNGKCFTGDCCATAECTDPAKPVCLNHRCSPCATNQQCGNGKVCCNGQCRSGTCCTASDCADRQCETKACTSNQCVYTPVASGAGPLCATQCCRGACIANCTASDECHVAGVCEPTAGTCTNPTAPNGTPCSGGQCQNGACVCKPKTCADLGRTCGTVSDGCGGTLCCGRCGGATACCNNGTCGACPACVCPSGPTPITLADGSTLGSNGGGVCLSPCSSNADCPCNQLCVASFTLCLNTGNTQADCTDFGRDPGAYCAALGICTL